MKLAANQLASAPVHLAAPASSPTASTSAGTAPSLRRQVFGYVNAGNFNDPSVGYTTWQWQNLTTVAYFGVHVNQDGTLNSTDLSRWSSDAPNLLTTAHKYGVKGVLSIIQQTQSTLCASLGAAQTTVTQTIANLDGADGVNIDYEGSQATCGAPGDTMSSRLDNLARLFRQQLPSGQNNLTIATYASAAEYAGGFFDIPGLGAYVDAFFVMAYDLDNSNYATTPLNCRTYCFNPVGPAYGQPDDPNGYAYNDTRAAETYEKVLGSGAQVIMGVPYYGWTACVQGTVGAPNSPRPSPNALPDSSSPQWSNPGYLDSSSDVYQSNPWVTDLQIGTDPVDGAQNQEPYATWWSPPAPSGSTNAAYYHNCWREMYWDDTTSLGAKYDVVNRFNLLGAGLFALDYGGGATELWATIASHFQCPSAPGTGSAWQPLPGSATDIGPAASCTTYVTGTDSVNGGHGIYRWSGSAWAAVGGGAVRVTESPTGPWIINSQHQIYRWNGYWQQLPGGGYDVAAGTDGSVWVVGTDPRGGGYGLWKWENGYWDSPYPGGGVRIAVDSSGQPWAVNSSNQIWRHTSAGWAQAPGSALDVGAGGNGSVWVIGTDARAGGYGIYMWTGGGWWSASGGAVAIGVDPAGMPWVVNAKGTVYERV